MAEKLDGADWARMIHAAAESLHARRKELCALDAALGDGDHGTAADRALAAADEAARQAGGATPGKLLTAAGWAIMGAAGGATGPLLGSFFVGLADGCGGRETLTAPEVAAAFAEGLANLRRQTPASVGDKTLIDALVPAVEALRAAVEAGGDLPAALAAAAEAAATGAASTAEMVAHYGRAHNLGERALGHPDPGATMVAYLLAAFAEAAGD